MSASRFVVIIVAGSLLLVVLSLVNADERRKHEFKMECLKVGGEWSFTWGGTCKRPAP